MVGEVVGSGSAVGVGHGFRGSSGKQGVGTGVAVGGTVGVAVGVGVCVAAAASQVLATFDAAPTKLRSIATPITQ